MEVEAERLFAAGQKDEALRIAAGVRAIKGDIKQAANPDYAFIFSAGFMHAVGGVQRAAGLAGTNPTFGGAGAEDTWMTGGLNIEKTLTELRKNPSPARTRPRSPRSRRSRGGG